MIMLSRHYQAFHRLSRKWSYNWDDIPYAQPPVGDLRWKSTQEILVSE